MKRWAVIGPIGSGKSTVTALLKGRGAAVVDGDRLGHEVLARPEIVQAVVRRFGGEYVVEGKVDRGALGRMVFAEPEALADLNAITHPAISELATRRLSELESAAKHDLAVLEAAVYFLFPSPPRVDLVVCVNSDPEIRRDRLVRTAQLDVAEAERRIRAQKHLKTHWARADVTLVNDGSLVDIKNAVADLWRRFMD